MTSEIVKAHIPCPDCGSSDGMTKYTDHTYCFVCEKYTPLKRGANMTRKLKLISDEDITYKAIKARGITMDTCLKYNYGISKDDFENPIQVAVYKDDEGAILFQKTRDKEKNFYVRGKKTYRFFGQHLFQNAKKLVITEGEIDCLTVSQVQGNKYPVVSIPFGTKSAVETFKQNYEWLNSFDEVIVMFDMDTHGREAVQKVAGILPPHKLKVAILPLKDPNECLLAGKANTIIEAIWQAKEYHPDGIVNAKDLKDVLFKEDEQVQSFDYPFSPKLNNMTQGIRRGEMLLLTAGTGIGKSTFARELAYKLKMVDNLKIGMVMLEESPKKTLRDILSIHLKLPLHLLWGKEDIKNIAKEAFNEVFDDGNFYLYDHFGSIEGGNLLDKIRYLIVAEGCDFVIFDHISIAVSGLEENNDERKCIDRLMTNLRALVEETGAGIIVVSHLRKVDTKSNPFEQGGKVTLDDLRGSGSLKQLPDIILALERNQQADSDTAKNLLQLRVLKNRFTGTTGLADPVKFDKTTHRILDVDPIELEETQQENNKQF